MEGLRELLHNDILIAGVLSWFTAQVMTTVETTITKEEEERCRKICEELGVAYRIREWEGQS